MEEEKKMEFLENKKVVCTGVEVETVVNRSGEIKRIKFNTDKGFITWKPKVDVSEFRKGIKILKKENMNVDDIPEFIEKVGTIIQEAGKVVLKVCYIKWDTKDGEGEPVTYRFIMSKKSLDKWVIVKKESVKEEVVD